MGLYELYEKQIEDFNGAVEEMDLFFDEIAKDEVLTNEEYCSLYDLALKGYKPCN